MTSKSSVAARDQTLKQKEGISGKTGEIRVESVVELTVLYQW